MKYSLLIFLLLISKILLSQNIDSLVFYYNNSQYFDAIIFGEKQLNNKNVNYKTVYLIGKSFQHINKYKDAEKYLRNAYLRDSTNVVYINSYAQILAKNKKIRLSIKLYKKALKIDSTNFNTLNSLSKLYVLVNKYKNAIDVFKIILKQDSLNSYYYRRIAFSYSKIKDRKRSFKYYKKAYDIDSSNILNVKFLAYYYYKNKKNDEAIEICNKGILVDSSISDFYKIKANSFYAKNHFYLAIPQYKKVIELKDSSYNVVKRLGMALCDIKKYDEALKYNLAVYNADSSSYSNTSYLSRNYLGLKEYEKSIEFAEKTEKLLLFTNRVLFNIVDNKIIAYSEMKDYKNALKMYDAKYKIYEKRYFSDYYEMALLYEKLNNKRKAIKYYEIVVKKSRNKESRICRYSKNRITRLLEELHFEGNK